MDHNTLGLMQCALRVPASENWRDVLGDIASLDEREQSHVLATLSMQIQKVPHTQAVDLTTAPLPFGRAFSSIT
ncbi:hypothetical protein [Peristeroidobacter soli]|uniref:hypothetical protein n=1 Tax=Peristeroidobacter soli TaxID=2497877 RepID=UPI00101C5EEE|nr:hypothetical protein [Peristeroidobacter soli]